MPKKTLAESAPAPLMVRAMRRRYIRICKSYRYNAVRLTVANQSFTVTAGASLYHARFMAEMLSRALARMVEAEIPLWLANSLKDQKGK